MTFVVDLKIERIGRKTKTLTGDDVNGYSVTCECGNTYHCESYNNVPTCSVCETETKKQTDPAEINSEAIKEAVNELEKLKASGCTDAEKYLSLSNKVLDLCYSAN